MYRQAWWGWRRRCRRYLAAPRREWLARLLVFVGRPQQLLSVPHGVLRIDLRDIGVGRRAFVEQRYEAAECALLRRSLMRGMTYLDVGGNLGFLATLAGQIVGTTGHVVAIEPEPYNFALLQENLQRNSVAPADAVMAAAGSAPGTATLFKARTNFGDHRLYADSASKDRAHVAVPVVRLDELFASRGWPPPDFVKIDVQGFELFVVQGLEGLVKTDRPRMILTEYWPIGIRNASGDPGAYLRWFQRHGFEANLVHDDGGLERIAYDEIDSRLPRLDPAWPDAQWLNLLFTKSKGALV